MAAPSIPAHGASFGCGAGLRTSLGVIMTCEIPTAHRVIRPPRPPSPSPGTRPIHFAKPAPQTSFKRECTCTLHPAVNELSFPSKTSLSKSKRTTERLRRSTLAPCAVRKTDARRRSIEPLGAPIWSRVAACPVGELRERAAELALQAGDVGAVADALEPLQHQRRILAVLPDLRDWRLRERDRPTQRLRQDCRHLRHRSYGTGDIDLAAVQRGGG